jgi:hypothetical protein
MEVLQKRYFDDGRPPESIHVEMPKNYVPALPAVISRPAQLLPVQDTSHTLNVPMQSTQHIEMKTSAVDRSKGFLIANVPLFGAFAVGVWLLSGWVASYPLFSFMGLIILWSSFVLAWLASYWYTLRVSAEGIAMFEARAKWDVVKREQQYRWNHYDQITGGNE